MKTLKYIAISAVIMIGLAACEKKDNNEVQLPTSKENSEIKASDPIMRSLNGTLCFETVEDFNSALDKISNMTHVERMTWEAQNDYRSLGTASDEFYNSIEPENFESFEEIIAFVHQNSQYLELVTDENGEISVNAKEENDIERYLMNENKMYQIGSDIYKKFDEKLVCTNVKNLSVLKNATSLKDLDSIEKDFAVDKVVSMGAISDVVEVTAASDGKTRAAEVETWDKVDNNRQMLWIQTKNVQKDGARHRRHEYTVKNQKRTLGVWFQAPRTTSYVISFNVYDDNPYFGDSYYYASKSEQKVTRDNYHRDDFIGDSYGSEPHFGAVGCWSSNWSGCYCSIKQ